jgi:hypothetical protein
VTQGRAHWTAPLAATANEAQQLQPNVMQQLLVHRKRYVQQQQQ